MIFWDVKNKKMKIFIYSLFWDNMVKNSLSWRRLLFFTLSNAKHGESIGIGLAAISASKGPQVKTTKPMVSIKVTNCSIQLGWILARDGFAKNYRSSRPEAKKCNFFISACGSMDGCYHFFRPRFFPHRWTEWNEIENLPVV